MEHPSTRENRGPDYHQQEQIMREEREGGGGRRNEGNRLSDQYEAPTREQEQSQTQAHQGKQPTDHHNLLGVQLRLGWDGDGGIQGTKPPDHQTTKRKHHGGLS